MEDLLNCAQRTTDKAKKCRISELHKFNVSTHAQILQDIHSNEKPFNSRFSLMAFPLTSYMHQFENDANMYTKNTIFIIQCISYINICKCMYICLYTYMHLHTYTIVCIHIHRHYTGRKTLPIVATPPMSAISSHFWCG